MDGAALQHRVQRFRHARVSAQRDDVATQIVGATRRANAGERLHCPASAVVGVQSQAIRSGGPGIRAEIGGDRDGGRPVQGR
jgi:hypothetical protein